MQYYKIKKIINTMKEVFQNLSDLAAEYLDEVSCNPEQWELSDDDVEEAKANFERIKEYADSIIEEADCNINYTPLCTFDMGWCVEGETATFYAEDVEYTDFYFEGSMPLAELPKSFQLRITK